MNVQEAGLIMLPFFHNLTPLQGEDLLVVDPGSKEEAASSAGVTIVMNAHNEVILLRKSGGLGISLSQVSNLPFSHVLSSRYIIFSLVLHLLSAL